METWMFIWTTVWAATALVLYLLECVVIVSKWKILKSFFFKIYFASSVVNCLTYLNSLVTLRIPNQTGKNDTLAFIFEQKHFFGLEGFYMLMNHFAFVQYLMTTLFAVNRLTAVILPLRYEKVWRKLFNPSMIFVLISPIVFTYPCLFFKASYLYQSNSDNGTITGSDYVALNNQLSYTLFVLTLITTVMNLATFLIFLKHRSSMLALLPYCSDTLTLLPPFVILLCSSVLQNGLSSMLCNSKIVHIVPSVGYTNQP